MSVTLHISCDGCPAVAEARPALRRRFVGSHGDWGFGSARWPNPQSLAPEGWMLSDPWTYCTYCPTCWAGLLAASEDCAACNEAIGDPAAPARCCPDHLPEAAAP